jgi:hypothetical protein
LAVTSSANGLYWDRSPLKYVQNVTTPILILHSDNDFRVPIEQGEQWFRALKHFGKTAEIVFFPRENHNLTRTGEPKHLVERWSGSSTGSTSISTARRTLSRRIGDKPPGSSRAKRGIWPIAVRDCLAQSGSARNGPRSLVASLLGMTPEATS